MNEPAESERAPVSTAETLVELPRLKGLADAVYAFALTLLVLDIHLPDAVTRNDLPTGLLNLAPNFLVYLISFVVIGGAWAARQRIEAQIQRADGLLVWFNLLSLLFVTLLPASATLLGRFPTSMIALGVFALDVILIQLSAAWFWRHATRNGLINPTLNPYVITAIGRRMSLTAVLFALSILLSFISPYLVYVAWIAIFAFGFTTDWLSWQQALNTRQVTIPTEGAASAQLVVEYGGGSLNIDAVKDEAALIAGEFGGGVDTRINRSGDALTVKLLPSGAHGFMSRRFPWAWGPLDLQSWTFGIARNLPIQLKVNIAGGRVCLELTELNISELVLNASAAESLVRLPAHVKRIKVDADAALGALEIQVPENVAAQIHATMGFSSTMVDLKRFKLVVNQKEYRSENYETAEYCADITVNAALGSVKIR